MSRWSLWSSRYLRWSNPAVQALLLAALTFGVVLPLACHRLLYSYYFLRSVHLDRLSDQALEESLRRGQDALLFWQNRTAPGPDAGSLPVAQGAELLITVVTARRAESRNFHYLLQVAHALQEVRAACGRRCAVVLCNVEDGPLAHEDAALLEGHFPVLRRPPEARSGRARLNMFEREKRDYVWCLRAGWAAMATPPRDVVVLEDDALPRTDFLPVLWDVVCRRGARTALYVKLYHPERLQRYWNPEPARLLEWAGLGAVGAGLLLPLARHTLLPWLRPRPLPLLLLALFVMATGELVGRHYLLEARRLAPALYAMAPATECCTPAMLFPGNASLRVARYLQDATCAQGHAKDMALYRLLQAGSEHALSLEPNLITHIGAFSSVRTNPPRPRLL